MLMGAFIGQLKVYIPANIFVLAVVLSSNKHLSFLNHPWLRSLGETTYSIYLLHGIVMFVVVNWIVTMTIARSIPEWEWWLICGLQVVVIVALARLSYEVIEKPGIALGSHLSRNMMPFLERRAPWITKWI
jgi:peptidoglycan/LPS O-acetylase OafA/YrhL